MQFTCDDTTYETTDMTTYRTQDAQIPLIYMTKDLQRVFVVSVNRWTGTRVRRADALEIERMAKRFQIEDLLRALPAPPNEHFSSHFVA